MYMVLWGSDSTHLPQHQPFCLCIFFLNVYVIYYYQARIPGKSTVTRDESKVTRTRESKCPINMVKSA